MEMQSEPDRGAIARIIDANANRAAEGVRVVEEIARFSLREETLTARLKDLRHEIRAAAGGIAAGAIRHRDAAADVGRESATASELSRGSIGVVARANFSRAQEALRVLEEFGKLVDEEASRRFKRIRFELYSIERTFLGVSSVASALPGRPFLYPILDRSLVAPRDVPAAAAALVAGGAGIIQYRAKGVDRSAMRRDLAGIIAAARPAAVPVVVNDDVELAVETGAEGAHIGAADMDPAEARAILGPLAILGVTVIDPDDLAGVPVEKVSYVAVGPVFASPTKPEVAPVGLDAVRRARRRVGTGLVAIGGITPSNAASVIAAGADGIAVVSALLCGDIRKNCFTFLSVIGTKGECG